MFDGGIFEGQWARGEASGSGIAAQLKMGCWRCPRGSDHGTRRGSGLPSSVHVLTESSLLDTIRLQNSLHVSGVS